MGHMVDFTGGKKGREKILIMMDFTGMEKKREGEILRIITLTRG